MMHVKLVILLCLVGLSKMAHGEFPADSLSKHKKIKKYMKEAVERGLPGITVYINTPKQGEWTASAGYSNIKTKEKLNKDYIFSLASIGKTYNAIAILKLAEEGKLSLDDNISKYLPEEIIQNLPSASSATIRHLLGHRTGWFNYENDPKLVEGFLSGHLKLDTLSKINVLRRYVYNKPAQFKPGESFSYSSTNFLLLAMIADKITGDHTEYLRSLIKKWGYQNTTYRATPDRSNVSYYGDLNRDGILEDLTIQTFETTNWFEGDDGVYAPIGEAAHLLQALAHGKILGEKMFREMTTWDSKSKPDYGLGLMADKSFPYKFLYGHSGRGIGVTTDLYYFPKQDITVAIFCNTGIRGSSPGFKKAYLKMRTKIIKKLFLF